MNDFSFFVRQSLVCSKATGNGTLRCLFLFCGFNSSVADETGEGSRRKAAGLGRWVGLADLQDHAISNL